MSPVSRIVFVEDFDYLPAGYKMLQTFGEGADALIRAVNQEIDEQLRRRAGVARFELAAHAFAPEETGSLFDLLEAIDAALKERPNVRCQVDVLAFMPGLFEASKGDRTLMATSGKELRRLEKAVEDLQWLPELRIWLLDGQADDGSVFAIQDIAEILEHFDPTLVPADLNDPQVRVHFMSFGERIVRYPRQRIVEDLSRHFALGVFAREPMPSASDAKVPFPLVTKECAAYLEQDVHQTRKQMDIGRDGNPIVPPASRPSFSADLPAPENLGYAHKAALGLMPRLGDVEAALVERRAWAIEEMSGALTDRVHRCADESDGHLVMAQAFLDVLRSGTSPLARGTQVSTGKPVTLEDAFKDSIEFFRDLSAASGEESGEDPDPMKPVDLNPLKPVTDLQRDIDEDEEWIAAQKGEIVILTDRLPDDGVAAKIEAKTEMIAEREAILEEKKARLQDLVTVETKWLANLETTEVRAALKDRLEQRIDKGVETAAAEVDRASGEVDTTKAELAKAEEEMRHKVISILLRLGGLALGLVIVALAAALLLPLAGLSFFGGPALFALFGGAVSFWLGTIWWVVSAVAFVTYALLQVRKYFAYRKKLKDLARKLETLKNILLSAYVKYWDAYSQKFYGLCDLVRHGHVFDTWRALERVIEGGLERLRAFTAALQTMLAATPAPEDVAVNDAVSELVVLDRNAIEELVRSRQETADNAASRFFAADGRSRSHYLEAGGDALRDDLAKACEEQVYPPSLLPLNVTEAIRRYDYPVLESVNSTPVFMPLDPESRRRRVSLVLGPDSEFLGSLVEGLHPPVTVVEADDAERLLLLRVAYDIGLAGLPSLGEG